MQTLLIKNALDYAQLSLIELTERIVSDSDRSALSQLHENRPLFRYKSERPLLMVDFLLKLKQQPQSRQWCNNNHMAMEQAFDLTLSKFLNIPKNFRSFQEDAETCGPDCRYYFRAFNKHIWAQISSKGLKNELEIEFMAAKSLQNFVCRHFYLSCLEYRRKEQKFVRKISYKASDMNLTLWIPVQMTSKMFDKWFKQNCGDGGCNQHDIQEQIDNYLFCGKVISLEDLDEGCKQGNDFSSVMKDQISSFGLAETVADEKSDNIDQQRTAIRDLGKIKLKNLVLKIFEYLGSGGKDYMSILTEFSLSKATFSRFAGRRWQNNNGGIPDLWKNTAHILAIHPDFIETVKEAGLWKEVCLAAGKED
ncbi:MAG: hypothetical protein A2Y10_20290 [Planctomycetes bacterium GWF2_41_51]|nr:MAG: hypothetical protein A2Y10_20290 [Planctomycetes bacterium GWF2_41_51]HBG25745.1 hypothetical protein [Phycisphaerales bacterium]